MDKTKDNSNSEHVAHASGSGTGGAGAIFLDGYCVVSSDRGECSWPRFKSNSWRLRLRKVCNSSTITCGQNDEPTTSSEPKPKRYTYAYMHRLRCSSPEILPRIDSQSLLEIAGSTAQTFKDVAATIRKREESKSSSKKGKKAQPSAPDPLATPKTSVTKKRLRETEETFKAKDKSRHKDHRERSPSQEKVWKSSKDALQPSKKKSKKEKNERSLTHEDKDSNDSRFNLSTLSKQGKSLLTDEETPTVSEETDATPKKKSSLSVNIKGWSKEKIVEFFDLKEFTIDISDFPHYEMRPSTSFQVIAENEEKEEDVKQESHDTTVENNNVGSNLPQDDEKDKENVQNKDEETSKRKRKRSTSSSSSCSSASSSRHRSSDDSDSEHDAQLRSTAKKKAHGESLGQFVSFAAFHTAYHRPCVECGRWLDDCILEWKEPLGPASVWCSRDCIERRVARAHEVLPEGYGALTLLRGDGQLLTTGPTLANLAEFIFKYPEYEPILPVAKKKKSEQPVEVKKSAPKVMSKDSDRIRFNVKRAFSDAFMKRTKMDKLKFTMKACKEIAESVEAALFKTCESNLNSPKYKGWTKTFIQNVTDCRNKGFYHRVLTGDLSIQKLVTLEAEDMRKSEYSLPLIGEGSEEIITESDSVVASTTATTDVVKNEEHSEDAALEIEDRTAVASTPEPSASRRTTSKKDSPKKTLNDKKKLDAKVVTRQSSKKFEGQKLAASSALDSILGDGAKDTTEQHLSHFYDVNCSICLAKQKSQAEAERKEREEKEKQREEERRFREMLPVNRRPGYIPRDDSDTMGIDRQSFDESKQTPESTGAACASDEEYAGSYDIGGDESPIVNSSIPFLEPRRSPSENYRERASPYVESVWSGPSTTVWNGRVSINNTMVMTSLCLVSNPVAYRTGPELPSVLRIKGRIVPVIVFDYVHGIVKNREHHVCVLRLTTPVDYDDEQRFFSLYEDMIRKGRYFAIEVPRDSCFKDMYLMPLPPGEEPPAILLPFDGPGIPTRHPPMIICVMVVYGSNRSHYPEIAMPFQNNTSLVQSPKEPPVCSSRASVSQSSSADENLRTDSAEAVQADSEKHEEEIPTSEREVPEPEAVSQNTAVPIDADERSSQLEPQSHTVASSPSDSSQVNFAPVCEADSLLPSKFFTMCKEAAKEPAKIPSAEDIDTLPDLLVYIQLNSNPKEIKDVVARFMMNPTLTDDDRELIRRKVMEKISSEKKKKKAERNSTSLSISNKEGEKDEEKQKTINNQESLNVDSIDLDALNQLSSFIGEGAKDLLMQVGEEPEPRLNPPPSPPPPPPPAPPLDELGAKVKPESEKKVERSERTPLACCEMLPGPPPVPPVYADNDSSESESPQDRERQSDSPSLPLPPPFPALNIVPLPPPPPVVQVSNIAVPPPPPPPAKLDSGKDASTEQPSASSSSLVAPPPPAPILTAPPPAPAPPPPQGQQMLRPPLPIPPPPGMFPMPVPPIPGMMPPGFPPNPFMAAPPPPIPGMMSGMPGAPGTARTSFSVPAVPPAPMMRPQGMPSHMQTACHSGERRGFYPCPPPGFVPGHPPGVPQPPQPTNMGVSQEQQKVVARTVPPNQFNAGSAASTTHSNNRHSFTPELAPLPSQLGPSMAAPICTVGDRGLLSSSRALPTGIIPSLGRALTERDLIPRTPTPPPSPPAKRPPVNRNGPRTPSPDSRRKRESEEAFGQQSESQGRKCSEQGDAKLEGNASDSDAMEVDAGESEGECGGSDEGQRGFTDWNTRPIGIRGRTPPRGSFRGMPGASPQGHRGMQPGPRGHGPSYMPPRGGLPQQRGAGFTTSQTPVPSRPARGRFFSPPMRGIRGAPIPRRGLPINNRGSRCPSPPRGEFSPPMRPFPNRGGFRGPQRGPRVPASRGFPPYRSRGRF